MGKNNTFINSMKKANTQYTDTIPAIYASVALALKREFGFGYERINRLFLISQSIWQDHVGDIQDMIALCETETGIKIMQKG